MLAETNQGYINSDVNMEVDITVNDVNMEVVKLCVEKVEAKDVKSSCECAQATVDDQEGGSNLLKSFKEMKSHIRKVR